MRFVRKWEGNYHYGYTDADAFTTAGQAILQKRAIFEIIKDSPFLQKKNSCKCRSVMVGGGARS